MSTDVNICKYITPCTNTLFAICLAGKYSLENLRKYLSGSKYFFEKLRKYLSAGKYFFQNLCKYLSAGKYSLEKLRKYLSAGKYSLENLRKYLSGRQILPWRTCANSIVFVLTTILKKQLLLQGGRRERLAVSYVMRWEIGVGNTKANPSSVHLKYLLIGVEKHRISQIEKK